MKKAKTDKPVNVATFTKRHLALTHFAAKQDVRPTLTGIHIDPDKGIAAACDGIILLEMKLGQVPAAEFPPTPGAGQEKVKECVVPAWAVTSAVKTLAKKTALPIIQNVKLTGDGNGKVALSTHDLYTARDNWVDSIPGQFPNYKALIPSHQKRSSQKHRVVCLSYHVLSHIVKAMGELGAEHVRFQVTAWDKPIRIEMPYDDGQETATGCVMPVKVQE